MKKHSITSIFIILLVLATSCKMVIGDEAVEQMNIEEKNFLNTKIQKITSNMSEREVSKILGDVYRGSGTNRPIWLYSSNDPKSQIAIYYHNGKIFKIRWLKLGSFGWEKNFFEK